MEKKAKPALTNIGKEPHILVKRGQKRPRRSPLRIVPPELPESASSQEAASVQDGSLLESSGSPGVAAPGTEGSEARATRSSSKRKPRTAAERPEKAGGKPPPPPRTAAGEEGERVISYRPTNAAEAAILDVVYLDQTAKSLEDILRLWDESRAWEKLWEFGALVRGAEFRYGTPSSIKRYLQVLGKRGVVTIDAKRGGFLVRPLPNTRVQVKGLRRVAVAPAGGNLSPRDEEGLEQLRAYVQSAVQGIVEGARTLRPDLTPLLDRYAVKVDLARK